MNVKDLSSYMADCRGLVLDEMRRLVPSGSPYGSILYDLVFDYPMRDAKALRPALCIAACRALGGSLEGVLTSATVLELYHNAFLVHDDVEDGSELRRDAPTLHRQHGVPVAINVGDAMLALALQPLLDNMRILTLGKALRILQAVSRMARESAEGQALELSWIRHGTWTLSDRDYLRMVHKKTTHYTFLAPVVVGGIVASAAPERLARLQLFATALGAAFQIKDDALNLTGSPDRTGKERQGDLWEGKHTLILLHAIRSSSEADCRRALEILAKARPGTRDPAPDDGLEVTLDRLVASGDLTKAGRGRIEEARRHLAASPGTKTTADIEFLDDLIRRHRSVEYALGIARRWAGRARAGLGAMKWLGPSVHRDFLHGLTEFVVQRDH